MLHLLYDLTAAQPTPDSKFHGAGEYAETVFLQLLSDFDSGTASLAAVYDSNRYLNPELINAANQKKVPLFDLQKETPLQIFTDNNITRFYSALLDESIPWPLDKAEIITTVHGLRSLEMPLDSIMLCYDKKLKNKIKDFLKLSFLRKRFIQKVYNGYARFFTGNMKIITVSQHSKASILSFFPQMNPEDITVFSSPTFMQLDGYKIQKADFATSFPSFSIQRRKYFLITSSARWIKNAVRALKALDSLFDCTIANGYTAVFTGVNDKSIFTKHLHHPDRFVFLGYIDRPELEALNENAYAFIYPSLNEGFGYPPLDSMKYGVPVAASGTSSVPEVCGDAALYFDPYSISEIKNRLIQLLDTGIRQHYANLALKQYDKVSDMQKHDLKGLAEKLLSEEF